MNVVNPRGFLSKYLSMKTFKIITKVLSIVLFLSVLMGCNSDNLDSPDNFAALTGVLASNSDNDSSDVSKSTLKVPHTFDDISEMKILTDSGEILADVVRAGNSFSASGDFKSRSLTMMVKKAGKTLLFRLGQYSKDDEYLNLGNIDPELESLADHALQVLDVDTYEAMDIRGMQQYRDILKRNMLANDKLRAHFESLDGLDVERIEFLKSQGYAIDDLDLQLHLETNGL